MVRIRMHGQGFSPNSSRRSPRNPYFPSNTISGTSGLKRVKRGFVDSGVNHDVITYQFPNLSQCKRLVHAVFTRRGGVSESPYNSLNIGYNTGDRPEYVRKNLQIIKETIGADTLSFMNQVHGKEVLLFRRRHFSKFREPVSADAIITDIPAQALMVKQADCQAVIIFDPVKRVLSNVHCGWRGNTHNILGIVVNRLVTDFGCMESDMKAAIGPSLGPCCAEFIDHERIFPEKFRRFMVREDYFDLWGISRWQLIASGLRKENIEVAGICTRCRTDLFYSYRGEGVTGRFATVAMLNHY